MGSTPERRLVQALRSHDEATFTRFVEHYGPAMLGVAASYVSTREIAEEVVQDTWLALLSGLDRFRERARLQTWLFRVLVNIARSRGVRERRCTPWSSLPPGEANLDDVLAAGDADSPEARAVATETWHRAERAILRLPQRQRLVVTLRDVLGCSANEVCAGLGITAGNQRVLLHRARADVRRAVERSP